MSAPDIGVRTYGKRSIRERWYECAILGCHVPESSTLIEVPPSPHAGSRVCLRCHDEPSYRENEILSPPIIVPDEEAP